MKYFSSLKLKLIYVFRINDAAHEGCLKIGEATCDDENVIGLAPNSKPLNEAARKRINQYTQTAGIRYDLLHTELTLYNRGGLRSFNDKEVHAVLERSGVKRKVFDKENKANEWFMTSLDVVKRAIAAVKEGKDSLSPGEVAHGRSPIVFRPEQCEAIEKTEKQFRKGNQMLWNAKMRFGKTLSALQVVKDMDFKRTLILTHRPVVDSGWFEDFGKIFYDRNNFAYGSKNNGESHESLERRAKADGLHYVYFVSMQDLRGSELVGGNFDKNNEVFATPWDLIIVDEAHEGTQTELGKAVMAELVKDDTKVLRLSGTPFNLLDDFKENEIYTWDYVMEQRAKLEWDKTHFGDPNPYAALPAMNIYTYDLGRLLKEFVDEDVAFNFREFFRVDKECNFIHERDVSAFLNLLAKEDKESCYPFASEEYRNVFRHTLWMVPGVKEAKALSALLQRHPVFQHFHIVNVAGDGDEDEENRGALEMVNAAIGKDPDATRTITLSCGRLTTGVSVPAWTAVFMLSGSYNTAASSYMQTIFRVQTPATINGRVKEQCYVFDFAPDRTLKVLAETAKISAKAGKTSQDDRKTMGDFLNFCPVISIEGSRMDKFDVPRMLEQLKKVYVERVVRNGFEDNSLYNDELLKLDDLELQEFDDLKKIIGQTKAMPKTNQVDINNQGLNNEEYEEKEKLEKKPKKELTEEEKRRLEELKKKTKNREAAISILRGISIRMPLLIYGAELDDEDDEITIDNFAEKIDPRSWEEFMPKGVSKQKFNAFKKYYDPDIFRAAGKRIRAMAKAADKLSVEERIGRITDIFSTFRNPDKETVLTPWRVVNMHLGDCLGGYCFFDKDYEHTIDEPRFIDLGKVTEEVFTPDSRILEINSKSGLYPLYMAYGIYRSRLKDSTISADTLEEQQAVWDKAVAENIFVVCKTPMAKSITKRTLVGFRKAKVNTRYFEDLINQIKNKPQNFIEKMAKGRSFWKANDNDNMKFNAIVGNPPYQVMDGGGTGSSAQAIYNKFVDIARSIKPRYISMIMPSRWMTGGKGLDKFRESMLDNKHIRVLHDYMDAHDCFPTVAIEGGICYFMWDKDSQGKCDFISHTNGSVISTERYLSEDSTDVVIRDAGALSILAKVKSSNGNFSALVSPRNLFKIDVSCLKSDYAPSYYKVFGRFDGIRGLKFLKSYETKDERAQKFLGKWKVFVSKADGAAGQLGNPVPARIIGKTVLGDPMTICTETFLAIGPFINENEANNVSKYTETKFFRFLVGTRKLKNMTQDTYSFVPLQDFTETSDIDWNKAISVIDQQLYTKYHLTNEEITFIEKMIKTV
jgi:hypothetical protein